MSEENNATICFTVLGNPIPLARPRFFVRKNGATGSVLPASSRAYRMLVQRAAKAEMKRTGWLTTEAPIKLVLRVYRKGRREADLSNILKGIEDALNTIVFVDDEQIVELYCTKEMRCDNPRVEVEVTALT